MSSRLLRKFFPFMPPQFMQLDHGLVALFSAFLPRYTKSSLINLTFTMGFDVITDFKIYSLYYHWGDASRGALTVYQIDRL